MTLTDYLLCGQAVVFVLLGLTIFGDHPIMAAINITWGITVGVLMVLA